MIGWEFKKVILPKVIKRAIINSASWTKTKPTSKIIQIIKILATTKSMKSNDQSNPNFLLLSICMMMNQCHQLINIMKIIWMTMMMIFIIIRSCSPNNNHITSSYLTNKRYLNNLLYHKTTRPMLVVINQRNCF